MANYYTLLSVLFPVGSAGNVAPALALYREFRDELDEAGEWVGFAAEADVIIVACSQDASSRGFVNAAFLAACRPGVVIVNVARGACPLPLCQRALHILYNTVTLHNPVGCSEYCDSGRLVVCVHQLRLAQLLRH